MSSVKFPFANIQFELHAFQIIGRKKGIAGLQFILKPDMTLSYGKVANDAEMRR